jgi:hypothetical protein
MTNEVMAPEIKRLSTAEWIYSVIDSCESDEHFNAAWELVRNFKKLSTENSILTGDIINYYTMKRDEKKNSK